MPFQRPTLPYNNVSLPNSDRYRNLSNIQNKPPSAQMLDADFDYIIDGMNVLQFDMGQIEAGILVGSDNPANANLLPTTNGAGTISWIKVGQQQYEAASITNVALAQGAVLTGNIGAGAITGPLIGPKAVAGSNIADKTVTAANTADKTFTSAQIADETITGSNIANQTITRNQMANRTITNVQIAGAFFRATVNAGVITQEYNQNVFSFTRTSEGVFAIVLNNTGAFASTIPIGVETYDHLHSIQYLTKSTYVLIVKNLDGIFVDPTQISFSFLYIP